MSLSEILEVVYKHHAWLSGSYVRERIVRQDADSPLGDIDILMEYKDLDPLLAELTDKFASCYYEIDRNEEDEIAHIDLKTNAINWPDMEQVQLDIFVCPGYSYLTAPDADVNTLCWTGQEVVSWFKDDFQFVDQDADFSLEAIIERCKRKEAVALNSEWLPEYYHEVKERVDKLVKRGWTILNEYSTVPESVNKLFDLKWFLNNNY